jgi:SAM-dependent methyltransferase
MPYEKFWHTVWRIVMKIILEKIIKTFIPHWMLVLSWVLDFLDVRSGRCSPSNVPNPPPPNTIPENMIDEYTQNGKIKILYNYFDNRMFDGKQVHNTHETYRKVFRQLDKGRFQYYGFEGKALLRALGKYSVLKKSVIIWGLAGCNCEALAVWSGADKVYVVDYNKPVCDNDRIEVINHDEITRSGIMADFAISYSSFEHDGLGRYGDPLSVNGDLRAMEEAHRLLAPNGILFLGIPLGQDCILWNANRIYGKYRLPILLKGWQLLEVFDANKKETAEYPFDFELGEAIQNTLVLKKIENDYPADEYLQGGTSINTGKTIDDEDVCKRINSTIYDYKHLL